MSIPVLTQVYDEVRRLAIAGSAVAPGDFRLKKLIEPLQKSGEKAPVFAKVAQAVQAVVESTEKTAANALLELTTLVNAILYTQGETGIAGELKPLECTDLGGQETQASARVLKPLLEALTSTGSGRMELIRDAHQRGTFKDLRLIKPALKGIDDPYSEIGEFIAENVLPMYGRAILPELRSSFDVKAKSSGHLHRLQLMHKLDPAGCRDLVQLALNDGSKEVKVAAIECLGDGDEDLAYLLEQSKAKAKDVRAAALRALASMPGTPKGDVIATLKKAIAGPDLEMIIPKVQRCALPEVRQYVLEQAEQQFEESFKTRDKKRQGEIVGRLQQLVTCLEDRTDAPAEAFLLKCFDKAKELGAIKSEPSGADLNELVGFVLSQGTPKMQERLAAEHKSLSAGVAGYAYVAARATMSPERFYDEFSPLLKAAPERRNKKNSDEYDRSQNLIAAITRGSQDGGGARGEDDDDEDYDDYRPWLGAYHYRYGYRYGASARKRKPLPPLDPRWLDAAVDAGITELACQLARPGHAKLNKFLVEQLANKKKPYDSESILRTMVKIGHPEACDRLCDELKKQAKGTTYYYFSYWYAPMIADLPPAALPAIEALLPTLPDKLVDQLMDSVIALKNKSTPATSEV